MPLQVLVYANFLTQCSPSIVSRLYSTWLFSPSMVPSTFPSSSGVSLPSHSLFILPYHRDGSVKAKKDRRRKTRSSYSIIPSREETRTLYNYIPSTCNFFSTTSIHLTTPPPPPPPPLRVTVIESECQIVESAQNTYM